MKKMIFLMLMGTLFTAGTALGFGEAQRFLEDVSDDIFRGIQTGDLTRNEVRELRQDMYDYQWTIWEADRTGRISRSERRKIETMERRLIDKLDAFLYNRNRVSQRFNQPRYRDNRNTNRTQARRNGGTIFCPPPRRNW